MNLSLCVTALAAASAFAWPAFADPAEPSAQSVMRAALVRVAPTLAAMQTTARHARLVLQSVREGGTLAEVACADEALSRADVALRAAREHAALAEVAWGRGDLGATRREIVLVYASSDASKLAAAMVDACVGGAEGTTVRVSPPTVAKR